MNKQNPRTVVNNPPTKERTSNILVKDLLYKMDWLDLLNDNLSKSVDDGKYLVCISTIPPFSYFKLSQGHKL